MTLPVFVKYVEETRLMTFDFTSKLADGDTLTGSATVVTSPGLTADTPMRSGNLVSVRLSGGAVGNEYTIDCRCATANGDLLKLVTTLEISTDAN